MDKNFKKANLLYGIFMTVIFSSVFTILSQLFATGTIDLMQALVSIVVVGAVAFCVTYIVPVAKWGMKLAVLLKLKPNTFASGVVISFVFAVIMVVVMAPVGAVFGMTVMGGLPLSAALKVSYNGWWMYLLIGWALAIAVSLPLMKLAMKLCKCPPAPTDTENNENVIS
jgi:hypothetical protein